MNHSSPAGKRESAPETTGYTLHGATSYDVFTNMFGLGANGSNSKEVVSLARIKPGDNVLDVACGTGSLTLAAKAVAGPQGKVSGIDAAPEMIAAARKKAGRAHLDVAFNVGLGENLDFPASTFDVVISRLAIHHFPDDLKHKVFAEMHRVLKPGGHLLIADFKGAGHGLLAHLATLILASHMEETHIWGLPSMLVAAGFTDVAAGPTRSRFLGFVSARKAEA